MSKPTPLERNNLVSPFFRPPLSLTARIVIGLGEGNDFTPTYYLCVSFAPVPPRHAPIPPCLADQTTTAGPIRAFLMAFVRGRFDEWKMAGEDTESDDDAHFPKQKIYAPSLESSMAVPQNSIHEELPQKTFKRKVVQP